MQRLIVTSAAYRQISACRRNCWRKIRRIACWRAARVSACPPKSVRDNALRVERLAQRRVGGPSVFPYQPKGLWEEMAFGDGFSAQTYVQSHGDDLYRRSMYTFWKRTVPPAEMVTFDAPDREKCTARRTVTNTPLQALVLLNDPTYVEAARALAQRTHCSQAANPRQSDPLRIPAWRRSVQPEPRRCKVLHRYAVAGTEALPRRSAGARANC